MTLFSELLNLLFPPRCAFCRREGDFLCFACVGNLEVKQIKNRSLYPSASDFKHLDGVIYGLDYSANPAVQAAIKQFKYRFTRELVTSFGELLAEKLRQLRMVRGKGIYLVPVPLHKERLNRRGFNQAELIALELDRLMGARVCVKQVLRRIKNTSQQARLRKDQRVNNLKDAFQLIEKVDMSGEAMCFLVDDVCTTGATLESCAKVLKYAGVKKVYGLVVARAFK